MDKVVKKYNEFLAENNNLVSEVEIREFLKEETSLMIKDLFGKVSNKFPMDNMELAEDTESFKKINEIQGELIETVIDIVIENIKDFNKTWENPDTTITLGDSVIHNDSGEEYFVSRFGETNNFYDDDKKVFIELEDVSKKKETK
jgi:hypothetical protein